MDRQELAKMNLEALRLLALEKGIEDARSLGKVEIIDRLMPPTVVERARHAVEQVVEKVEHVVDKVEHAVAKVEHAVDKIAHATHRKPPANANGAATASSPHAGFGVPSSTVHPHFEALPAEPMGMLDYEELPETYGVDECEVLYKDPFSTFAYWEVTDAGLDAARRQLGQSAEGARLVLRHFWTLPGSGDRHTEDVDLSWNHGRRYTRAMRPGAHLRVAVGLLSKEGYFAPVAHSSLLAVPPSEPQPGPVEWMEVLPIEGRGRALHPITIVRRGSDHHERGLERALADGEVDDEKGGSSPTARRS